MDITLLPFVFLLFVIVEKIVSILVLMDITLLHWSNLYDANLRNANCFNPCFNGYYTSTISLMLKYLLIFYSVSILVLMDITLLLKEKIE